MLTRWGQYLVQSVQDSDEAEEDGVYKARSIMEAARRKQ